MVQATFRVDAQRAGQYRTVVAVDTPFAWWRLGEPSGSTTAADSSSTATYPGTYTNSPTLGQTGALGDGTAAVLFDGTNDYVDMGTSTDLAFTGAFSAEFLLKSTQTGGSRFLLGRAPGSARGWSVYLHFGTIRVLVYTIADALILDFATTLGYNDGAWHHVIVTWDGTTTADKAIIYIDGVSVKTATAVAGTPGQEAGLPFRLGARSADEAGTYFSGTLDEVSLYTSALSAARVLAHYNATLWTSLAADLAAADPLTWRRGMAGGGPMDLVATTGTCEFSLMNHAGNSGATAGWYSPNHASVRSGWTYGIPIRVVATYSGSDYTLWTGKLRSVDPIPGLYAERRVACVAHDIIADVSENDVREIAIQVDKTENALFAAVIAAVPDVAQPSAVTYDGSLDTYTYALDNASTSTKAMSLIADIAASARAYVYPLADGSLHIENRQARTIASSSFTFTDATLDPGGIDVPSDLGAIFNHVRVTTHPKTIDTAASTVLFGITGIQIIPPGQTVDIWGDFTDPDNSLKLIGGTDAATPIVETTDYMGNSAENGSGSNLTSYLSVTTTAFAAAVKFAVTNNHATVPIYLVDGSGVSLLRLRGNGIYDNAPISYESASAQAYGDRLLDIDLPYQDDGEVAQNLANFLTAQYALLADQVNAIAFNPQRSDALMVQALTGEIGDVLTVTETMTGVVAADVVIQAIEGEVTPGPLLHVRYVTAPRGPNALFILDDSVYGELDSVDARLAYA